MMDIRYSNKIYSILFVLVVLFSLLNGASTGKIAGMVRDEATGEPLPGANVIINDLFIGAATDINGYYVLLNVPPGIYDLKFSVIGYNNVVLKDVQVQIDLTTNADVNLKTEALGMEEIVVIAERPVIKKDVSSSEMNVSSETIESLPVNDVNDVVSLQAGIEDGFEIRGGSARQASFIVDGFSQNDERSRKPFTNLNISAVKEIKVQTGGFNAEYGQSRSGVINIVTKSGSKTRYNGSLSLQYTPAGNKHFGKSVYNEDSYYLRSYLDPDVCYVGTANGSWDVHTQDQYPTFEGWNYISEQRMSDDDPDNDLTPEQLRRIFQYQHRRDGTIDKPDYIMDASLGGPVPFVGQYLGDLRFFATYRNLEEQFIVPLSRDSYDDNITTLKLTSDITERMQLTMNFRYSLTKSASKYNWSTTPTGDVLRSDYDIAYLVRTVAAAMFVPSYYSPTNIYRTQLGAKLNHVLSDRSYYELKLQYDRNYYRTFQTSLRDTTADYDVFPGEFEYLMDEQPYGYWGYSVESVGDGISLGGWQNLGRDSSFIKTYNVKFDYVNQFNSTNQFKTGIDIVVNNFDIKSYSESPSMGTWNREQSYNVTPYRIGLYAQDKMEFQGFIANIGLRLDYSDANTEVYKLEIYDEYYEAGNGFDLEDEVSSKDCKPQWALSPRLGISHPITDNSKLYFNYGHFRSEPSSTYRFRLQRYYNGQITSIGNPNLEQEKTVAYEIGYSHNLFNKYLLNVAGYYKDISDQIGWIDYYNMNSSVSYSKPDNNYYEDIRGVEFTLEKKVGTWMTGFVNYTYMVKTNGHFGYEEYYEDPTEMQEYIDENPTQEKPKPQPFARANVDLHTPDKYGPDLYGIYPLGGWNMNMIASWKSGEYATYNPNNILGTDVVYNCQWKDYYGFDMRISKRLEVKKTKLQLYLNITNVFNFKKLSYTGFSGTEDYYDYMSSLHFDWEDGSQNGDDRIGEYRDWDVDYVPMSEIESTNNLSSPDDLTLYYISDHDQYMMYVDESWVIKSDSWVKENVLDKKAYIDMPNVRSFTFLNPRTIEFGIKISF